MNLTKLIDLKERIATSGMGNVGAPPLAFSSEERDYLLTAINRSIQIDRIATMLMGLTGRDGASPTPEVEEFLALLDQRPTGKPS